VSLYSISPRVQITMPHLYCSANYLLQCPIEEATFMNWESHELRRFEQGHSVTKIVDDRQVTEVVWLEQLIPAPYDRILSQLLHEDAHAEVDHAHEALRCQAFVR
jgi:hypothetical protein